MKPDFLLIQLARKYNLEAQKCFAQLAIALVEIEEKKLYLEAGYDSFPEFYTQDLQRDKSTVSKLLKVGRWLIKNRLVGETPDVSVEKLYLALNAFPEKSPEYILSAAKTNTAAELKDENSERLHGVHEHIAGEERWGQCQTCDRFIRV